MIKQAWEKISETTARLKVPGGWLYRVIYEFSTTPGQHFSPVGVVMNTVFVPEQTNIVYVEEKK